MIPVQDESKGFILFIKDSFTRNDQDVFFGPDSDPDFNKHPRFQLKSVVEDFDRDFDRPGLDIDPRIDEFNITLEHGSSQTENQQA